MKKCSVLYLTSLILGLTGCGSGSTGTTGTATSNPIAYTFWIENSWTLHDDSVVTITPEPNSTCPMNGYTESGPPLQYNDLDIESTPYQYQINVPESGCGIFKMSVSDPDSSVDGLNCYFNVSSGESTAYVNNFLQNCSFNGNPTDPSDNDIMMLFGRSAYAPDPLFPNTYLITTYVDLGSLTGDALKALAAMLGDL